MRLDDRLHTVLAQPWEIVIPAEQDLAYDWYDVDDAPEATTASRVDPRQFAGREARALMTAYGDPWPVTDNVNFWMALWADADTPRGHRSSIGFVMARLDVQILRNNAVLAIDWPFAWIAPPWRGQGFGYHLAVHFANHLESLDDRIEWDRALTRRGMPLRVVLSTPLRANSGLLRPVKVALEMECWQYNEHQARAVMPVETIDYVDTRWCRQASPA
jgi:GNAT superfamily N-acetyltransferase